MSANVPPKIVPDAVDCVRELASEASLKIADILRQFESDTGVAVESVDVRRSTAAIIGGRDRTVVQRVSLSTRIEGT